MATGRVTISLNTYELAFVQDAMRVYSQVISADLGITPPTEVQFDDAVCDGNWHMGLITVEEIRSQIGGGTAPPPQIRAATSAPRKRKKKGKSALAQARKSRRTAKRVMGWLK